MKKLDLNIELGKAVKDEEKIALRMQVNALLKELKRPEVYSMDADVNTSPVELAINWIGIMIERALNNPKPDKDGINRATTMSNMQIQRKYTKVMDAIDDNKNGVVELEDDDFDFLARKFCSQSSLFIERKISKILVAIEDAINLAKIKKKEKK